MDHLVTNVILRMLNTRINANINHVQILLFKLEPSVLIVGQTVKNVVIAQHALDVSKASS